MILNNDGSSFERAFEVVHEVKNSIAVCRGYLDIIDSDRNDNLDRYVSIMREEINRSMNIISDFMLYRRINVVKEIIDINLLLKDLCEEMELFVSSREILFECDILEEDIYIDGDYNKLKQVFINLIKNGVEAIDKEDGYVQVWGYRKDGYYCISINDNGCGMTEELLDKIKKVNFTTKKNGNGIGVSFSNQIILEHNGFIDYKSEVGVGTKVIVKLPLVVL